MSILPVLGHKPITSYFSRASSAKRKRKEAGTSSTGGNSKRPKQSASSASSKLARPTKDDIGGGLKATNRVDSPCTPPSNHSWTGTLPTPPLTCISRPCKGPEKEPSSSPQRSETPRCREEKPEDTLASTTPKDPFASFPAVSNVTPAMPELTIPSSQSQDSHASMEMPSYFSKVLGDSSLLRSGEDLIIESSQSQFLIMASPNARKLVLEPTLPAFNVVIPSSQSQEEELIIPMENRAIGRYLV
jgi:hypothetical protein